MKQEFSTAWKSSVQPRKQRKYRYNAPYHTLTTFMSITLNKVLRQKHGKRNVPVRTGDKIKILRGTFKGKTGHIEKVDKKQGKVFVTGIEQTRKDGNKNLIPFEPSNLQITELNIKDKRRIKEKKPEEQSGKETPEKA